MKNALIYLFGPLRVMKLIYPALALISLLVACSDSELSQPPDTPFEVEVSVDGSSQELVVDGGNVREVLDELGIDVGDTDIVAPPLFTPITENLSIEITRVTEGLEVIEQTIPFQRRSVRNESMSTSDPSLIIQAGNPGLQEITVRIVYHDGLEYSRQETQVNVIEQAQDEIVMIGIGAAPGNIDFLGVLAYINGGNSVILRGSTAFPEQIDTGGDLDHRVFKLSPVGNYLLFTQASNEDDTFNTLWIISTDPDSIPIELDVDNVLWADWNPNIIGQPQIAFSTGVSTDLLPGWEANNDLWIGDLPLSPEDSFEPQRIIDAYPATYGWWGGNYAWSPGGQYIAYSFADEVGVIDLEADDDSGDIFHSQLKEFTEYNTRSDWVWIPSLSWSPDGQFIVFSQHSGEDPDETQFDTWAINISDGSAGRFVNQAGMWSYPFWSPSIGDVFNAEQTTSKIAYLKATNALDTQRSSYTLWLMDRDGSNTHQIYPAVGENSKFAQDRNSLVWGPNGKELAFVYDGQLFIFDLESLEAKPVAQDDNLASNPTWAPYGKATESDLSQIETITISPRPTRTPTPVPEELEPVE